MNFIYNVFMELGSLRPHVHSYGKEQREKSSNLLLFYRRKVIQVWNNIRVNIFMAELSL